MMPTNRSYNRAVNFYFQLLPHVIASNLVLGVVKVYRKSISVFCIYYFVKVYRCVRGKRNLLNVCNEMLM